MNFRTIWEALNIEPGLICLKKIDLMHIQVKQLVFILLLLTPLMSVGQIELNGSYSYSDLTKGMGGSTAYSFYFKNPRIGIKPQFAYKCHCSYDSFLEADFTNKKLESHVTFFYQLVDREKYKLAPNLGFNLRYSSWTIEMLEPLDELPIRRYISSIRDETFSVQSTTGSDVYETEFLTPGFTAQVQNQFVVSDRISLNLTPFIEFDYDRAQAVGGGYFGFTYNH